MEYVIIGLAFLSICVNPAMAGRYLFGYRFDNERNLKHVKALQLFNGVASIVLFVLLIVLFDKLAEGYVINW